MLLDSTLAMLALPSCGSLLRGADDPLLPRRPAGANRPSSAPTAPLVALAGLEGLLDGPAAAGDADQLTQRDDLRGVAAVERQLASALVAPDQQPPTVAIGAVGAAAGVVGGESDPGPVVVAFALGARAGGELLPGPPGQA